MNPSFTPTLTDAMRRVSQHWPLAYGKLLALRWESTTVTPYGATDGRRLLLNPAGLAKLEQTSDPIGLTAFLLVHEALHALLSHATRTAHLQDGRTVNIAADYVINALIKQRNVAVAPVAGFVPFPFIEGILYDENLSGDLSVEQLYTHLLGAGEQQQPQPQPQPGDESDDSDSDSDSASDSKGDGEGEGDGEGDGEGEGDGDGEGEGEGDGDGEGEGDGNGNGNGKPSDSDILGDWVGTGAADLAEPQPEDGESRADVERAIEEDNERHILSDAINQRAGIGGGGSDRTVEQARRRSVGVNWAEYLRQFLSSSNRNGWDAPINAPIYNTTGVVAAGRRKRALDHIAVIIDTSISVPQALLQEMLGEVQAALDSGTVDRITVIACDHQVRQSDEYEFGDTVLPDLRGGGGTSFRPAFDHVEQHLPDVDGIVFLTDGEAWDWHEVVPPQAPVLWLDYGQATVKPYTFGEVVTFCFRR